MGCVGSPTDVHRGKRRTVAPDCRAGGRSASFRPSAFPGQATKRASLASCCPWGAWPPIPLRFVFTQLLWVRSVRRPGAQAWARLFFAAPMWAGGWSGGAGHTPAPLSGGGGPSPSPRGGCRAAASPLPFRAAACGTPFWLSSWSWRAPFRRARAVGAEVPPRGGGGARGGPWTAPLGVPADLQTPPLSPRSWLWLREGHAGRGLLRVPLYALLRHAGVGSWGQVQPLLPLPCRCSSCGPGRPPGPGGAEGRPCGSPAGLGAGGGGGGAPPRPLSGLCGGGGGSGGGPSVPWRCLLSANGGGAAWRSRPRGPAIGQGGHALPPPPSTESRILT